MGKEQGILATRKGRISRDGRMVWTVLNLDTGGCNGESQECTADEGLESGMETASSSEPPTDIHGWREHVENLPAQRS